MPGVVRVCKDCGDQISQKLVAALFGTEVCWTSGEEWICDQTGNEHEPQPLPAVPDGHDDDQFQLAL